MVIGNKAARKEKKIHFRFLAVEKNSSVFCMNGSSSHQPQLGLKKGTKNQGSVYSVRVLWTGLPTFPPQKKVVPPILQLSYVSSPSRGGGTPPRLASSTGSSSYMY